MPRGVPSWFAADQVYRGPEGWYIGSPLGFRVGPYPIQATAVAQSREITATIARCRDNGEVMRKVRAFISSQCRVAEPAADTAGPVPPAPEPQPQQQPPVVTGSVDVPPLRKGEQVGVWFRTSRYFAVGDAWFFATRENVDVGPYPSRSEAERDAELLLRRLAGVESDTQRTLLIREFKARAFRD